MRDVTVTMTSLEFVHVRNALTRAWRADIVDKKQRLAVANLIEQVERALTVDDRIHSIDNEDDQS